MRIVFALTALFLAVSADGDVLAYTDSNFEELIKSHEVALVKFYAPWPKPRRTKNNDIALMQCSQASLKSSLIAPKFEELRACRQLSMV
ncbi:unnamed protein product [Cylicostephanus goldi]|uniref:Thioredoxin domain-containing protein n=1 Tax=Cylicostephanus goldi TaxID=71465 RepID=A0A3P7MW99_CYLGO|nr:unnamed protein product [Cylicostephanus goldi]